MVSVCMSLSFSSLNSSYHFFSSFLLFVIAIYILSKPKEVFKPKKQYGKVYEIANANEQRKVRASAVIKALAILRGGAKQAAFGTEVSPKCYY
jgi:hypothetical protein